MQLLQRKTLDLSPQREQTAPSAPDEHGSSKWRLLHVYLVFDSATCPGSSDFKSSNSNSNSAGLTDVVIRCISIRRSSTDLWIYGWSLCMYRHGFWPRIPVFQGLGLQDAAKTTMNEYSPRTLEKTRRPRYYRLAILSRLSIYIETNCGLTALMEKNLRYFHISWMHQLAVAYSHLYFRDILKVMCMDNSLKKVDANTILSYIKYRVHFL